MLNLKVKMDGAVISMFKGEEGNKRILIYNPLSIFYLVLLLFLTIFLLPYLIFAGRIISYSLEIPPKAIFMIFLLSLFGSQVNLKIREAKSIRPVLAFREISFFGVKWCIPEFQYGIRKTIISVNVGGALIPVLFSLFLLFYSIPALEQNLTVAYLKVFVAFIVVTRVVHKLARPIKGLGIAVPFFIPPLTAALASAVLFPIYVKTNPFIIAYVGGTLGTLVGADLLNLGKISEIGAPIVSIGGAGIFDGVYLTGITAIFILWLIV